MIRVGFRLYCPDGEKSDSMGQYTGYTENMDEYIGVHTCKIQRPNTQTTLKDLYGNSVKMDDATIAKLQSSMSNYITDKERQAKQDTKDMEMIEHEG